MSQQQTKEQQRAKAAWESIAAVRGKGFNSEYSSTAKNFPMMTLTNGLGQALAFLRAKGKREHRAFYHHLSAWVTNQMFPPSDDRLLERLLESESNIYRQATTEALAFAAWLKRFAEAELDDKKPSHPEAQDQSLGTEAGDEPE